MKVTCDRCSELMKIVPNRSYMETTPIFLGGDIYEVDVWQCRQNHERHLINQDLLAEVDKKLLTSKTEFENGRITERTEIVDLLLKRLENLKKFHQEDFHSHNNWEGEIREVQYIIEGIKLRDN